MLQMQPKETQPETSHSNDFTFSYTVTEGTFAPGEQVVLSVGLTNNRSESYVW